MRFLDVDRSYRHIWILESRDWWANCRDLFDPARDLVLTYDFGLQREVTKLGGKAFYIDHLVDKQAMQENNFLAYQFLQKWYLDREGKDVFVYRGISFGAALRLEIWNDFIFYIRNRVCLERLRGLRFEKVFVGTLLGLVEGILEEMKLPFSPVCQSRKAGQTTYYFPIHQWMDEKVRYKGIGGIKYRLRDLASAMQGSLMSWVDQMSGWGDSKPAIFVQEYHPTRKLIQRLQQGARVRLVLATFSRSPGWFRYIPVWGRLKKYQADAKILMQNLRASRCLKLVLSNGVDVSESIYRIIDERISVRTAETIRTLDCVMRYLGKNPVELEVLIANIGHVATLVDCVCKAKGVPSYLIINGFMSGDFLDESKNATIINSYSVSIKKHYFRGMDNIVCLGDPRMDSYVREYQPRTINRDTPTVTIGASAHSVVDLNSYLAVEFDFMYDILSALKIIKEQGAHLNIVIKTRANGYRWQYEEFVREYFPELEAEILDAVPFGSVMRKTDFYISLYSQTLFEASCLGIPCLYYKNDCEILDPPFDGNSELVTVGNVEELVKAIADFRSGHKRYDAFLQKSVMEKYIGPLDGGNLERNLNFIYEMLEKHQAEAVK